MPLQQAQNPLLARLLAPDYTGVGGSLTLLRGLECATTTGSESPSSQTAGTRLYWCRRQSDLSHLTSTEEASAGSS